MWGDSKSPSHQMMLEHRKQAKKERSDSRGFAADYGMTPFRCQKPFVRCLKTASELVPRHLKEF